MLAHCSLFALVLALFTGTAAQTVSSDGGLTSAGEPPRESGQSLLDEVASLVEQQLYSRARLDEVGWSAALSRARAAYASASESRARTEIIRALLAALRVSHTQLYLRDDPAYWALASIFEPVLIRRCSKDLLPSIPVSRDDVGVHWKQVGKDWFVGGLYAAGPAEKAGLKLGDRVLAADGRPFSPVQAFWGKAGTSVALRVQRSREGAPMTITVTPRTAKPQDEYRQSIVDSWRMLEHRGRKIAYLRVWAWTGVEHQMAVLDAVAQSNAAAADGFVIDLRDGWGGAAPQYLGMFFRDVPVLESIGRDGKSQIFDQQIRKPTVILINGGTRSGKEVIAYGAKKHHLARLVGERTAGAVMAGTPFCLSDGSLLLLAAADVKIDGERLEGRGVAPDIEVPFDIRFAAGRDPQLQRALDVLTGK